MNYKINFNDLIKTCYACPSQWEGYTVDNHPVYIRFRHGCFYIQIGPKSIERGDENWNQWFFKSSDDEIVYIYHDGSGLNGWMKEDELYKILWNQNFLSKPNHLQYFKLKIQCRYQNFIDSLTIHRSLKKMGKRIKRWKEKNPNEKFVPLSEILND